MGRAEARPSEQELQPERLTRIARKAKTAQLMVGDFFSKREVLKPRAEKFGMQQGLQRAPLTLRQRAIRKQAGDEMMLIGETD